MFSEYTGPWRFTETTQTACFAAWACVSYFHWKADQAEIAANAGPINRVEGHRLCSAREAR